MIKKIKRLDLSKFKDVKAMIALQRGECFLSATKLLANEEGFNGERLRSIQKLKNLDFDAYICPKCKDKIKKTKIDLKELEEKLITHIELGMK